MKLTTVLVPFALLAGLAAASLHVACQPSPEPAPVPPSAGTATPAGGRPPAFPPPKTAGEPTDPAALFQDPAPDKPRIRFEPREPELAFTEWSTGLPGAGTWRGYPLLYDFDQDGRDDLVASNREEDGYNVWLASKSDRPESATWRRCIGGPNKDDVGLPRDLGYGPSLGLDLDGDGDRDLLVSAHKEALRAFLNVPGENPESELRWVERTPAYENPYLMIDIALGNLDGDAHPDVVGVSHFKGGLAIYSGDGKGGFRRRPESSEILDLRAFGQHVEAVDLDGNGLDDIVAATNRGLKAYLNKPGAKLAFDDISTGLPNPKIGNSINGMAVGRFRNKPMPEIAMCLVPDPMLKPDEIDSLGVFGWNAEKRSWEHVDSGLRRDEIYRELGAADLNADGNLDLLAASLTTGIVVYLGDGTGAFKPYGRLPGLFGIARLAFGDVNADGLVDIAVSIPATKERPDVGGLRVLVNRKDLWK